jgi:hypothetical protein
MTTKVNDEDDYVIDLDNCEVVIIPGDGDLLDIFVDIVHNCYIQ